MWVTGWQSSESEAGARLRKEAIEGHVGAEVGARITLDGIKARGPAKRPDETSLHIGSKRLGCPPGRMANNGLWKSGKRND